MIKPNNKIKPADFEICNILAEESAEVIQAVSKIFRFGWDSCHPNTPNFTNKDHLEEELGDILCIISLLGQKKIINMDSVQQYAECKKQKLINYSNIKL